MVIMFAVMLAVMYSNILQRQSLELPAQFQSIVGSQVNYLLSILTWNAWCGRSLQTFPLFFNEKFCIGSEIWSKQPFCWYQTWVWYTSCTRSRFLTKLPNNRTPPVIRSDVAVEWGYRNLQKKAWVSHINGTKCKFHVETFYMFQENKGTKWATKTLNKTKLDSAHDYELAPVAQPKWERFMGTVHLPCSMLAAVILLLRLRPQLTLQASILTFCRHCMVQENTHWH